MMRRAVLSLVVSVGLIVAGAGAQAGAASTRAEYIAQVDPICQANLVPVRSSGASYQRSRKKMNRLAFARNVKAWLRQTRLTASALNRYANAQRTMIDQIALIPPPPADSTAVASWVNGVRQADVFRISASAALRQLEILKVNRLLTQAAKAQAPAYAAIADFGFQVCWQKV
jgi:hypothetical protein